MASRCIPSVRVSIEIERIDRRIGGQELDHPMGDVTRHDLGPFGTRADVTVMAGHVAELAGVDLQSRHPPPPQPARVDGGDGFLEAEGCFVLVSCQRSSRSTHQQQLPFPPHASLSGSVVKSYASPLVSRGWRTASREQSKGFASSAATGLRGSTGMMSPAYGSRV